MPKKSPFAQDLKYAYYKYAKIKGRTLIEHAMARAYEGKDAVLIALLKKVAPDLLEGDGIKQEFHSHLTVNRPSNKDNDKNTRLAKDRKAMFKEESGQDTS